VIVIIAEAFDEALQMAFSERDHEIETFPAKSAHQPFAVAIRHRLPNRSPPYMRIPKSAIFRSSSLEKMLSLS
jgi:hypothetical protein